MVIIIINNERKKYIISYSFIFFYLYQDTTISVPPKEPDNTKKSHRSNDIIRTVIISIGSTIILYWYYLYCYICTRKFTSSPQELVHFQLPVMFTKPLILQEATDLRLWSIECAFAAHQIQTMNKMFDIIYQLWYFQIFFLMNCIFPICCLRSKLYLKVLLLQQLWCTNY